MDPLNEINNNNNDDDDVEMNPSDFQSLGFARAVPRNASPKTSPTSIVDAFVAGYERDKLMEEMSPHSLALIAEEKLLDFDNDLPDFTSDILRDHDEYNLPVFQQLDSTDADKEMKLLEKELDMDSTLDDSPPTTPFGSYRNHQVPLLPNHKHTALDDGPLLPLVTLHPLDPVLRQLDYSLDTIFDSTDSLSDRVQQEVTMETTSAFQQQYSEASSIGSSSPSVHSLDESTREQGCEELRDSRNEEETLEETPCSFKKAHVHTEEPNTESDVNGDATNALANSDDTVDETEHTSYLRFSPSNKDRIYISVEEITDQDIFGGQHARGSSHPGNVKYRKLVADNSPIYQTFASNERRKKTKMRNEIIQKVGGRFVDLDDDGLFYVLTRTKVNAKVSQALRDKKGAA